MEHSFYIGFDPREVDGYAVARHSLTRRLTVPIPVRPLILPVLRAEGLYTRPTAHMDGRLFDVISDHPMSTEFAISRFLVPHLVKREPQSKPLRNRWALFMDSDVMIRGNLARIFDEADSAYAVMVVKHQFDPGDGVKMDNQVQSSYPRKNWSSVILFNVDHPANRALTLDLINGVPGRDLHAFCWLQDHEIGELRPRWNYLVGHHKPADELDPRIVHFTEGLPLMKGYEYSEFSNEWREELWSWAGR